MACHCKDVIAGVPEKISFEAHNESNCPMKAVERYKKRTSYYQERVPQYKRKSEIL